MFVHSILLSLFLSHIPLFFSPFLSTFSFCLFLFSLSHFLSLHFFPSTSFLFSSSLKAARRKSVATYFLPVPRVLLSVTATRYLLFAHITLAFLRHCFSSLVNHAVVSTFANRQVRQRQDFCVGVRLIFMLNAFARRKWSNVPKRDMSFLENYVSNDTWNFVVRRNTFFRVKTLSLASKHSIDSIPSVVLKIFSTRVDTHPINPERTISQILPVSGNNNILIILETVQQPPAY